MNFTQASKVYPGTPLRMKGVQIGRVSKRPPRWRLGPGRAGGGAQAGEIVWVMICGDEGAAPSPMQACKPGEVKGRAGSGGVGLQRTCPELRSRGRSV